MKLLLFSFIYIFPVLTFAADWEGTYSLSEVGKLKIGPCSGTMCKVKMEAHIGGKPCGFEDLFNLVTDSSATEIGECQISLNQKSQNLNIDVRGRCNFCNGGYDLAGFYSRETTAQTITLKNPSQASQATAPWFGIKRAKGHAGGIEINNCNGTICKLAIDKMSLDGQQKCNLVTKFNIYNYKEVQGYTEQGCKLKLKKDYEGIHVDVMNQDCNFCEEELTIAGLYHVPPRIKKKAPEEGSIVDDAKEGNLKGIWRKAKGFFKK